MNITVFPVTSSADPSKYCFSFEISQYAQTGETIDPVSHVFVLLGRGKGAKLREVVPSEDSVELFQGFRQTVMFRTKLPHGKFWVCIVSEGDENIFGHVFCFCFFRKGKEVLKAKSVEGIPLADGDFTKEFTRQEARKLKSLPLQIISAFAAIGDHGLLREEIHGRGAM